MMVKKNLCLVFLFCNSLNLLAEEFRYLNRSPKALLMGDAFTAIADDEYTLFYNPAAMGRHKGLSVNFLNPDLGITNVLGDTKRFQNLPTNDPVALSDRVLGVPLYLHAAASPNLKMSMVGVSLMANATVNAVLENATHPSLNIDYRYDRGFVLGYAYTFGNGGKQNGRRMRQYEKRKGGKQTSIGLGVKNINRQGISQSYDLFGLSLLNRIKSAKTNSLSDVQKAIGYSNGQGWGFDGGIEQTFSTSSTELNFAASVLDIGDTYFSSDTTSRIPKQYMSVNLGSAFHHDLTLIDYTFSFDVHPANANIEFQRMVHMGFNFNLPFIGFMVGWNAGYVSYGVNIDIWPINIMAGIYGVEMGAKYEQFEAKRAIIYLSILDFSFSG